MTSKAAEIGQDVVPRAKQKPQALAAHHEAEVKKWTPMIKAADLKADELACVLPPTIAAIDSTRALVKRRAGSTPSCEGLAASAFMSCEVSYRHILPMGYSSMAPSPLQRTRGHRRL